MSKVLDLTGKKINKWTVLSRAENNSRGGSMWLCECECGTLKIVRGYTLKKGTSKSCGCLQRKRASEKNFKNLIGQKFGRLTVINYIGSDNNKKSLWNCQCDCEAKTIIKVRTSDLTSGKTTSCGCIKSVGEEKIALLLSQAGIIFEKEKTFDNCRFPDTNKLARFDFYVDNKYLIEYDGIQHFEPSFDYLNKNNFKNTKKRDEYKNNWCKENNIPLIRIKYTQLNNLKLEDLLL